MEAEKGVGNCNDYGARWYDASIGRFTTVDPLASDYSFQSPYAYATNNPVLLRDIMGMGTETIIVGEEDQDFMLEEIHARTDARYTFNDKDELVRDNSVEQSSDAYSDKIDKAIGSEELMVLEKGQMMYDDDFQMDVDMDYFSGGGVTEPIMGYFDGELREYTKITITGNSVKKTFGQDNQIINYKSPDILMHEIVGHGLPAMGFPGTGNAIKNENEVRKKLNLKERKDEKDHYE